MSSHHESMADAPQQAADDFRSRGHYARADHHDRIAKSHRKENVAYLYRLARHSLKLEQEMKRKPLSPERIAEARRWHEERGLKHWSSRGSQ